MILIPDLSIAILGEFKYLIPGQVTKNEISLFTPDGFIDAYGEIDCRNPQQSTMRIIYKKDPEESTYTEITYELLVVKGRYKFRCPLTNCLTEELYYCTQTGILLSLNSLIENDFFKSQDPKLYNDQNLLNLLRERQKEGLFKVDERLIARREKICEVVKEPIDVEKLLAEMSLAEKEKSFDEMMVLKVEANQQEFY